MHEIFLKLGSLTFLGILRRWQWAVLVKRFLHWARGWTRCPGRSFPSDIFYNSMQRTSWGMQPRQFLPYKTSFACVLICGRLGWAESCSSQKMNWAPLSKLIKYQNLLREMQYLKECLKGCVCNRGSWVALKAEIVQGMPPFLGCSGGDLHDGLRLGALMVNSAFPLWSSLEKWAFRCLLFCVCDNLNLWVW